VLLFSLQIDMPSGSITQQHEELLRPSAALIIASAQPRPALTAIASAGQFLAQAHQVPHDSFGGLLEEDVVDFKSTALDPGMW